MSYSPDSMKESAIVSFISATGFIPSGLLLLVALINKGNVESIDLMYVFVLLGLGFGFLLMGLSFSGCFDKKLEGEKE